MGKFDIPAVLNFILSKTNRENLIYIGQFESHIFRNY